MNLLLLNCTIYIDSEIEARLESQGHRVFRRIFDSGDPEACMEKILGDLPPGIVPDVTVVWSADYCGIPSDIETAPGRTVIQINDYHIAHSALRPHLSRFDTIWTDRAGVELYRKLGFSSFIDSPLYSYAANIPPIEMPRKEYDIVFVGGINHAVHWERSLWLRRLGRLAGKHKILITGGVFGEEYYRTLAKGKLIFNQGVRREMNMRCFEAGPLGGLLLMEKNNLEAPCFFPDGEAAAYYDEENFEQVVDYYLSHETAREAAARRSKEIAGRMLKEQIFQFVESLSSLPPHDPSKRSFLSKVDERLTASAVNIVYKAKPQTDEVAESLLRQALAVDSKNFKAWNNLAAVQLRKTMRLKGREKESEVRKAIESYKRSIDINPEHFPALLSLGKLCLDIGLRQQAEAALMKILELSQKEKFQASDFEGLLYPGHFDYFRMARERLFLEGASAPQVSQNELRFLFALRAAEFLGDLRIQEDRPSEALLYYLQAYILSEEIRDPIPSLYHKLAELAWSLGDAAAACAYGERFDQLAPLETDFWEEHLARMLSAGYFSSAGPLAEEYLHLTRAYTFAAPRENSLLSLLKEIRQRENPAALLD